MSARHPALAWALRLAGALGAGVLLFAAAIVLRTHQLMEARFATPRGPVALPEGLEHAEPDLAMLERVAAAVRPPGTVARGGRGPRRLPPGGRCAVRAAARLLLRRGAARRAALRCGAGRSGGHQADLRGPAKPAPLEDGDLHRHF